jgi:hypothetical protein
VDQPKFDVTHRSSNGRLDVINVKRLSPIRVAAVGNPGTHVASLISVLPGMSAIATRMMEKKTEKFDIPGIPEFVTSRTAEAARFFSGRSRDQKGQSSPKDVARGVDVGVGLVPTSPT